MGHDDNKFSRRQIVSGLGVGLAATVVRPAFAENMTQAPTSNPLQDPTTKYPKPPFKIQSQPWPGLASKWSLAQITAKPVTVARAVSPVERH